MKAIALKPNVKHTVSVMRAIALALNTHYKGTENPKNRKKIVEHALETLNSNKYQVAHDWREILLNATDSRGYTLFEEV